MFKLKIENIYKMWNDREFVYFFLRDSPASTNEMKLHTLQQQIWLAIVTKYGDSSQWDDALEKKFSSFLLFFPKKIVYKWYWH